MRNLLLAALLFAAPLSAQLPDSIPVPYPVAIGGAVYHVLVDSVATSQHTTLHGGLREAGLRKIECTAAGVPCEVLLCNDVYGGGFCYRMELRWLPVADAVPVEPEPEPVIALDSLRIEPGHIEAVVGESAAFDIVAWYDGRPWSCVVLNGELGLLERERVVGGGWEWRYPAAFLPAAEACTIDVRSSNTDVATVTWVPQVLDALPTPPESGWANLSRALFG